MATDENCISMSNQVEEQEVFYTSKLLFNNIYKLNWTIEDFERVCKSFYSIQSPTFPSTNSKDGQWYLDLQPDRPTSYGNAYFTIRLCNTNSNIKRYVDVKIMFYNSSKVLIGTVDADIPLRVNSETYLHLNMLKLYEELRKSESKNVLIMSEVKVFDSGVTIIEESLANPLKCDNLMENIHNLLDDEDFKDVTFKVGDKKFTAHKAILKVRSPVFAAMFKNKMSEQLTSIVEIPDIKPGLFETMLRFIYSDKVENLKESALELFYVAEKYQVEKLKIMCINILHKNLSLNTVVDTIEFADLYSVTRLKDKCLKFLKIEFKVIKETGEFQQLIQRRPHLLQEIEKEPKTFNLKQAEEGNEYSQAWNIRTLFN